MAVQGQPEVDYRYDNENRLKNIATQNSVLGTLNFGIDYDDIGRRTSLALPNGVTTNYTYDNASHLLNLQNVNSANQILESLTYQYDAVGNRTSMTRPSVTLPMPNAASNTSYSNSNEMLTFTPSSGSAKSMTYDDNGNMTSVTNSCGTTYFTWDSRNRLIGISGFKADCSSLTAAFRYDALGRRIEKTINGRTIDYFYDGLDIVQEIENGAPTVNYIRTLNIDEPLLRITSNALRFYQQDALGSVIGLTTADGQLATVYT